MKKMRLHLKWFKRIFYYHFYTSCFSSHQGYYLEV